MNRINSLHIIQPLNESITQVSVQGGLLCHMTHFSFCEVNWGTTTKMSNIVQYHSRVLMCAELIPSKKQIKTHPHRKLPHGKSWQATVTTNAICRAYQFVPKNVAKCGRVEKCCYGVFKLSQLSVSDL